MLAAQKENSHWHFGFNAALEFVDGVPQSKSGSALSALEGCAAISDSAGKLLFYTDGMTIWNKDNNIMQNGSGLLGDKSSSQSALIVPKPGSKYLYYVISSNGRSGNPGLGAYYTEVDMRLDNGRGGVSSTMNIKLQDSTDEKLAAVRHSNGRDIWILIPEYGSDAINAYLLTDSGFSSAAVRSRTGLTSAGTAGCIKVSPNGKYLALCAGWSSVTDRVLIAGFNAANGQLINPYSFLLRDVYGAEFSPNGRFLYIGSNRIWQLDLEAGTPAQVEASMYNLIPAGATIGGLQTGPNGKIYFTILGKNFLGCIDYPDMYQAQCGLRLNAVNLGNNTAGYGLQNIIAVQFSKVSVTFAKTISNCKIQVDFKLNDYWDKNDVQWFFGDSLSDSSGNTASGLMVSHEYKVSGIYRVQVKYRISNATWEYVNLTLDLRSPFLGQGSRCLSDSTGLCKGQSILLGCPNTDWTEYLWVDESSTYRGPQYAASIPQRIKYQYTDQYGCQYKDSTIVYYYLSETKLGSDTAICVTDTITIRETSGRAFLSYRWSNGDTLASITALPGSVHILTSINQNGCRSSDTIHVQALPLPDLEPGNDTTLCTGEILQLSLNKPGCDYWVNGLSVSGITALNAPGKYVIKALSQGCVKTDSIELQYLSFPETELGNDDSICFSRPLILDAGIAEYYAWNTGSASRQISVSQTGVFKVTASNGRCSTADSVRLYAKSVTALVPDAFSPGKDGHNDVFRIHTEINLTEMQIFNRWGEMVFYSTDTDAAWDGNFQGKPCPQDVYLLLLSYRDCAGRALYLKRSLHLLR